MAGKDINSLILKDQHKIENKEMNGAMPCS
jgi:hypothetical protein